MSHDSNHEYLIRMVDQLQGLITEKKGNVDTLEANLLNIFASELGDKNVDEVKITCRSGGGDVGVLRVLDPTESTVSVDADPNRGPSQVDFFLTRPAGEGKVETRLLGTAKYPDSDKKWSVRFLTDRYAESPFDPLLLHAEIRDFRGTLVAVGIGPAIC